MSDQNLPHLPLPACQKILYTEAMTDLQSLVTEYGVNTGKPFFPVNSLRILYFFISDVFSGKNADLREKIGSLIPKVEAVFATRAKLREANAETTIAQELAAAAAPIQDVYAVIDTPNVHSIFNQVFSYLYPLQDGFFLSQYHMISSETPLTATELYTLLSVRAMDSIVFSTLISEMVQQYMTPEMKAKLAQQSIGLDVLLHHHVNLAYQINDLVDAIVFAKGDLETGSFSPFQVIRKVAPEPATAKELIKTTLDELKAKGSLVTFPNPLQQQVTQFYEELVGVVRE